MFSWSIFVGQKVKEIESRPIHHCDIWVGIPPRVTTCKTNTHATFKHERMYSYLLQILIIIETNV